VKKKKNAAQIGNEKRGEEKKEIFGASGCTTTGASLNRISGA
jgi:hypothetical protein